MSSSGADIDGGISAMAGFLFQLLGSVASLCEVVNCDQDHTGILILEFQGQDALVGKRLIQFKYSQDPDKNPVQPSEFVEIIKKLKSVKATNNEAKDARLELRTNRPLSPWAGEAYHDMPSPKAQGEALENLKIIRQSRAEIDYVPLDAVSAVAALRRVSHEYGVLQNEWGHSLSSILGELLQRGAGGGNRRITQQELLSWLVGHGLPQPLSAASRQDDLRATVGKIIEDHRHPSLPKLVRREALSKLRDYISEPVVVVRGHGGCGKSLSLLQQFHDSTFSKPARLFAVVFLGAHNNNDPCSIVHRWRNGSAGAADAGYGTAIERLIAANPDTRPILILGLDGIDECPEGLRGQTQQLVSFFQGLRKPNEFPAAQLIVTCRTMEDFKEVWYRPGTGGDQTKIPEILLDDFTSTEFEQAWSANFIDKLPFGQGLDADTGLNGDVPSSGGEMASLAIPPQFEVLRHPVLFGIFTELDPQLRRAWVEQEGNAGRSALAGRYTEWFCEKSARRRNRNKESILAVLKAAARSGVGEHLSDKNWIEPAAIETGESRAFILSIFKDAVTCGLLTTPVGAYALPPQRPVTWRWRLDFMAEYLNSLA